MLYTIILATGLIQVANSKVFCKLGNGTVRDLTLDTNTVYTHPSTKQCTWTPDTSAYIAYKNISATKNFSVSGYNFTNVVIVDTATTQSLSECMCAEVSWSIQFQTLNTPDGYVQIRTGTGELYSSDIDSDTLHHLTDDEYLYRADSEFRAIAYSDSSINLSSDIRFYLNLSSGGGNASGTFSIAIRAF